MGASKRAITQGPHGLKCIHTWSTLYPLERTRKGALRPTRHYEMGKVDSSTLSHSSPKFWKRTLSRGSKCILNGSAVIYNKLREICLEFFSQAFLFFSDSKKKYFHGEKDDMKAISSGEKERGIVTAYTFSLIFFKAALLGGGMRLFWLQQQPKYLLSGGHWVPRAPSVPCRGNWPVRPGLSVRTLPGARGPYHCPHTHP